MGDVVHLHGPPTEDIVVRVDVPGCPGKVVLDVRLGDTIARLVFSELTARTLAQRLQQAAELL